MSHFFIRRPIVAIVIAILTVIVGAISIATLPVAQFPQIAPPEIRLQANYPGADAQTLEQGLRLARANWQEAVVSYQQTVQNALEQVSNSLIASQKNREFREQQELLTQAAQTTDQLSEVLYNNGGASYLQVLTSETNYFSAELNLVQAQLNERLALVQLYQALGGGWQQ
jgi:outer membrane protein, multidrug efflux system